MKYIKTLIPFLIDNYHQIKTAAIWSSIYSFIGVTLLQPFLNLQNWAIDNIDYIVIALGIIGIDHLLGSIVHRWITKDFDWKKNIIGFFLKLFLVLCGGYIFEGLSHLTKDEEFIYIYIKMVGRLIVCIYPSRSAFKNMKILSNGAFKADAVIGKMDRFSENLDLNEFKDKNNGPTD